MLNDLKRSHRWMLLPSGGARPPVLTPFQTSKVRKCSLPTVCSGHLGFSHRASRLCSDVWEEQQQHVHWKHYSKHSQRDQITTTTEICCTKHTTEATNKHTWHRALRKSSFNTIMIPVLRSKPTAPSCWYHPPNLDPTQTLIYAAFTWGTSTHRVFYS